MLDYLLYGTEIKIPFVEKLSNNGKTLFLIDPETGEILKMIDCAFPA